MLKLLPSIDNAVKMVIWDLDDTFWKGTLAEGGAQVIDEHCDMVRTLASRGIISSIASNNDHEAAKHVLEKAGIWDYFVFPSISYNPKGKRVSEIVEHAALRPENILFIDDNVLNLEEVRFFNPGIMLGHPADLLPTLLSQPQLTGKPDPDLKRLKQYQLLQRRFIDQQTSDLSNEDFLRGSDIKIFFDFDVEANFDRVVELINRTNQLNYTKVRLETDSEIEALRATLCSYGVSAACISCCDRYGDYGIIGFYLLKRTDTEFKLIHFLFSCRTMNMGIEQFVYRFLGEPEIAIVPDVAYGLDGLKNIDWIAISELANRPAALFGNERKLLLLGGCELQQLASYCSPNRTEFVNKIVTHDAEDYKIRYDDPYFLLTDRSKIALDEDLGRLAAWTYDDAILFDRKLAESDIIIVAMRAALRHHYVRTKAGNYARTVPDNIDLYRRKNAAWFQSRFEVVDLSFKVRLALIRDAFDATGRRSNLKGTIFVIGAGTQKDLGATERAASAVYNQVCREYCRVHDRFHFVDVATLVPDAYVIDDQHMTPAGYRLLSGHILQVLDRT